MLIQSPVRPFAVVRSEWEQIHLSFIFPRRGGQGDQTEEGTKEKQGGASGGGVAPPYPRLVFQTRSASHRNTHLLLREVPSSKTGNCSTVVVVVVVDLIDVVVVAIVARGHISRLSAWAWSWVSVGAFFFFFRAGPRAPFSGTNGTQEPARSVVLASSSKQSSRPFDTSFVLRFSFISLSLCAPLSIQTRSTGGTPSFAATEFKVDVAFLSIRLRSGPFDSYLFDPFVTIRLTSQSDKLIHTTGIFTSDRLYLVTRIGSSSTARNFFHIVRSSFRDSYPAADIYTQKGLSF